MNKNGESTQAGATAGERPTKPFRDATLRPDSDLHTVYDSSYDPEKLHEPIK